MTEPLDGTALVYCQGAFRTPTGKTAHGLVRRTRRYRVAAVIDGDCAGQDAGEVLDGKPRGIPLVRDLAGGLAAAEAGGAPATHFVIGMAPEGGVLAGHARDAVLAALRAGLHVDSGLHHFLNEDAEVKALADAEGLTLRDLRCPPDRRDLHSFTGKIREVESFRVAVLGTDSAVGKRTTAWEIVEGSEGRGLSAQLVGTGQTAWLQGAAHGVRMDGLVNDFVAGEIEHAVWSAWKDGQPDLIALEGQGSMLNPIFPGGFELVCAAKPHVVVLQHAPARADYNSMPGFPMDPLADQIQVIELVSRAPVVALTVNHEGLEPSGVPAVCERLEAETGLPCMDVLLQGRERLVDVVLGHREKATAS